MTKSIDFKNGVVIYNNLNINPDLPLNNQIDNSQEDLLQVEYGKLYVLDVGWYHDGYDMGNFVIYVIKNHDWDNPIVRREVFSSNELYKNLQECINFAADLHKQENDE